MKMCSDCNIEMIENAKLTGQHPFEIGIDGSSDMFVEFFNNEHEVKGLFGKTKMKKDFHSFGISARVCPNCGKVELYINKEDLEKITM